MTAETELHAGPELDARIARVVFGIDVLGMAPCHHSPDGCDLEVGSWDEHDVERPVRIDDLCICSDVRHDYSDQSYHGHISFCLSPVLAYSTTWEGLGLVVERMRELGFDFTLSHAGRDGWFASFKQSMPGMSSARNRSAPHAVSLAALKILEEKQ